MSATPQQLRQWSEEVAADPGSLAFLPLAQHYRDAGRLDAALRLVLRGLERHPNDVEAHHLLGLLYLDGGDEVKAFDEWDIALALPRATGARRQIAFLCHARGDRRRRSGTETKALGGDIRGQREVRRLWRRSTRQARVAPPRRRPAPADGRGRVRATPARVPRSRRARRGRRPRLPRPSLPPAAPWTGPRRWRRLRRSSASCARWGRSGG